MKMKLTVLACAALFGLTACSSGGNSGVSYGGTIGGGQVQDLRLLHPTQIQHLIQNQHPTPRLLQILTQLQIQHLPLLLLHQQHSMVLLFQQKAKMVLIHPLAQLVAAH